MWRDEAGVIYLDFMGSKITKFEPENGAIEFTNCQDFKIRWIREEADGSTQQHMQPPPMPPTMQLKI